MNDKLVQQQRIKVAKIEEQEKSDKSQVEDKTMFEANHKESTWYYLDTSSPIRKRKYQTAKPTVSIPWDVGVVVNLG